MFLMSHVPVCLEGAGYSLKFITSCLTIESYSGHLFLTPLKAFFWYKESI